MNEWYLTRFISHRSHRKDLTPCRLELYPPQQMITNLFFFKEVGWQFWYSHILISKYFGVRILLSHYTVSSRSNLTKNKSIEQYKSGNTQNSLRI